MTAGRRPRANTAGDANDPDALGAAAAGTAETADLNAVKRQFLEAEQRLRELAQGAVELTRASVMLKKARMGISDGADGLKQLSERLSEYIETLADLTRTLGQTSSSAGGADSSETRQQLERIDERIEMIHQALSASQAAARPADAGEIHGLTGEMPTDEVAHGKLDRLGEQLGALHTTIEEVRHAAAQPRLEGAALAPFEERLDAVHAALEALRELAGEQLAAQAALSEQAAQASAQGLVPQEPAGASFAEAAAGKLDLLERGLAAIHQIVVRVENGLPATGSQPEAGPARAEVGQKLDALAQRLDSMQESVQAAAGRLRSQDLPEAGQIEKLDARLAEIQSSIARSSRVVRHSAGDPGGVQLGLYPDLENVLDSIADDLRNMEAINIDMVAELRRSLGLEITRQSDALTQAFDNERSSALSEVAGLRRMARWLVVGVGVVLAGVLYLILR